ncbi:hypothetical protein PHLCEN_2v6399 [Hermanssonia centrifuga]|uniref:LysM domain-containing protein n=1 Tax=Hermanssonia centrifuga TaxID=98765 RepID=A0A2R6NZH5_9APHY|nr:hypothetical protein PHLCEN_2v6399 [Hermanssonia centrifuga]
MFASSVLVALVALPFVAQSVAADCTRTYTITDGDICDSISAAHNVSTYQLAVVNPKIDAQCNNLQPGDTLCLGLTGQDCTTTYVVSQEDTCDLITSKHSINSTMLWANNPQINADCSNLYVGEVLCAGSVFAAPPPPASMPAATIPATAIPAGPTSVLSSTPAITSAAPTPSPSADDDDDDIPFCDEL